MVVISSLLAPPAPEEERTLVVHEHGRLHVGRQLKLKLAEAARGDGESLVEGVLPGRRSDDGGRVDAVVVGVRRERVERRVGRDKLALSIVDRELLDLRWQVGSVLLSVVCSCDCYTTASSRRETFFSPEQQISSRRPIGDRKSVV